MSAAIFCGIWPALPSLFPPGAACVGVPFHVGDHAYDVPDHVGRCVLCARIVHPSANCPCGGRVDVVQVRL